MNTEITGIGWVTAASMGCGKDHSRFSMPDKQLPEITSAALFDDPYLYFRRMDKYSKLGLTAIAFALKDAGLNEWTEKRNIGIIASTVYGCLGTDVDYYDTVIPQKELSTSPALFSHTLPNSFLGEAAIHFGLTGTSFIVNEQVPSGLAALQTALSSIGGSEAETMLCGICDLGCPPSFDGQNNVSPGALFFVIEKCPDRDHLSYGKLRLNKKDSVTFNRAEIGDLTMLVQKCLETYCTFGANL